mgnify:CR=1 FL=1
MQSASFDTLVNDFLKLKPDAEVQAVKGAGSTYCMITNPEETCKLTVPGKEHQLLYKDSSPHFYYLSYTILSKSWEDILLNTK